MRDTIVRRSVFIAVFWLAGSDPCSARIVSAPTAKTVAPISGNVSVIGNNIPSLTTLAPLGAPSLFPIGTLPTLELPVLPETVAARANAQVSAPGTVPLTSPKGIPVASPAPAQGNSAAVVAQNEEKRKTPVLESLKAVAGRITKGRAGSPIQFLRRFFDANSAGNFADDPVDANPKTSLPPYIKIANQDDAKYLAEIYEAALKSKTARKVFAEVEEYTGNGREPVIFEFSGKDGGSFTSAWEVVRLSKNYNKDTVEKAASALVHELVHVLQKGKDLPFNGLELEIEAFIKQLKVARELGVKWGKDDFHYGLHRALKASVEGFIDYIHTSDGYEDSITLVGHDFEYAEQQLRDMEKESQRAIDSSEEYYKQREQTLKLMRKLGYPEFRVKAYRGDEVLATEEVVVSHEAAIHLARRDQRILRTRTGRQRYLKFTRDSLKEARQFRTLLNSTDQEGAPRKKSSLRLPSKTLVDRYEAPAEPPKRKTRVKKVERFEIADDPSPLPEAFRVANREDERWVRALLDSVRESPTGRRYLEAVERRAKRESRKGRPWVIEFYDGRMNQGNYYYGKWDLLQMNRRHQTRSPREYAPDFVQLLGDLLHDGRLVSYALETSIESYASAFMVIQELDLKLGKSNPLFTAEKHFRKSFDDFMKWLRRNDSAAMLLELRGIDGLRSSIERRRKKYAKDLKMHRENLRERRATYRLMRAESINHALQRFFRADEVVGTE